MSKRIKTKYAGVYYKERTKNGKFDKYFIIRYFNKNTKKYKEEGLGFHSDGITPSHANSKRNEVIRNIKRNEGYQSLHDERQAIADAEFEKINAWTYDRLWQDYKDKYEIVHRKTYKGVDTDNSRYNKYIKTFIGSLTPLEVKNVHIDNIRDNIYSKKLAPQTQKNILELIRRISNWAEKENKCKGLAIHIRMPSVNNKVNDNLSIEEVRKVLTILDDFDNITVANIIKMAIFTGMRKSEILNIKWEHFDFIKRTILIKNPKNGKDQTIPLNSGVEEILNKQKSLQLESDYTFPNPQGLPYSDIRRHLNHYKKLAGLKDNFRPLHGLRSTYASIVSEAVDIYLTKELLTHGNIATTERYVNPNGQRLLDASEGVAKKINSSI